MLIYEYKLSGSNTQFAAIDEAIRIVQFMMPYRFLCNDVQREGVKLSSDLASGLFCYVPLHNIRYGIQFIRNACLRLWMDERGISKNDLLVYCAVLAKDYLFASGLNSQARQVSADRAWFAISRFGECQSIKR